MNEENKIEDSDTATLEVNSTEVDKEKENKTLFIINIVVNTIFYIFIFLLLMFSISQIRGSSDDKVKNVFGLGYENVLSDSMYVKDRKGSVYNVVDESRHHNLKSSFDKGDLIWVNTLSGKEKKKLKIGQIVTFWDTQSANPTSNPNGFLNTHRIVDIIYDSEGSVSSLVMQGDMWRGTAYDYEIYMTNHSEIPYYTNQQTLLSGEYVQIIGLDVVRAKYTGHWDNAGTFVNWLSNPKKGFIFVIFIAAGFLIFEMFMVIKNVMAIKSEKLGVKADAEKEALKEEMAKSLEDERERIRAELLAELQAKQAQENKAAELSTEEENQVENNEEPDVDEDSLEATIDENDKEDAE